MAVSIYDIQEGKWYVELTNGDRVPCGNKKESDSISKLTDEEIKIYERAVLTPRLQEVPRNE